MKKVILSLAMSGLLMACAMKPTVAQQTEALTITGKGHKAETFEVEIARDDQTRAHGLMNRTSLPERGGMLFVYDSTQSTAFWMKNTLIPLDMLFIDEKGVVTKIHPMAEPESRAIIKSGTPVKAGLEINGGMAKKLGLKAGDTVHHRIFGNELARP